MFALVGDKPAVVFWCCDGGERVLWRHLRTLNMAMIPQWAADGGTEQPADGSGQDPTAVTFRHYDQRVLGALMSCLKVMQFARVLGPAQEIAFFTTEPSGLRRLMANAAWPPHSTGLLRIGPEEMTALATRNIQTSRRRIMTYLREVAPDHTRSTSDDELLYQVQFSESVGKGLGIQTERAQAQWAFLMVVSKGQVASEQHVVNFISRQGSSPDRQVDKALRQAVAAARTQDGTN